MAEIAKASGDFRSKARAVNGVVAAARYSIVADLGTSNLSIQDELIVLEYCTTVANLEYRNKVWSYEYMALSRRMGELWERFCKSAWETPLRANVVRTHAPNFAEVMSEIHLRVEPSVPEEIKGDFNNLIGLIDPINMNEDEVFTIDGKLHVIDFKSGFGSNEKGNTLRLLAVGRAYKLYDPDVELLFLVRQKQNNNYLNRIRTSNLWGVFTGVDAYEKIDELTGSHISALRAEMIDFQNDLTPAFWQSLGSEIDEVKKYFDW
ncbi:hypothetical protein HX900_27975 [Rhizobium sp. WYCCWR 11290]|uniref:Uncharacterized protein n=1 Tax=Rhizobium changzhiense TaxID=2692317 RepID=A0A7Z0UFQ0_9HYPH|nr:hypothetical protein [Rhizobium changzhiense]NZD64917.1 hypothetical protein [Rhizobium changzhiense]